MKALDAYVKNADLGDASQTLLVQPFVALSIHQFTDNGTLAIGFGQQQNRRNISNDSLIFYNNPDDIDKSKTDASILLPKEVIDMAENEKGW